MPHTVLPEQELLAQLLGVFIRVRWVFVACLALVVVAGSLLLGADLPIFQTLGVGAVVLTYNVAFHLWHRSWEAAPAIDTSRVEAGLQIGLDLMALTALVHFLGGAESPFVVLYLIHGIAGGLLLPRRSAILVAVFAFALFVAMVAFPHAHPAALTGPVTAQHVQFEILVSLALLVTLAISVSIAAWITGELNKRSKALRRALDSLAQRQDQLLQKEKQASLGQLVAGIAHEINNPIQFIHGNMAIFSEAFSDTLPVLDEAAKADPELRIARLDYPYYRQQVPVLLKDMADGASRIRAIVRDLRTYARSDEQRVDEEVDVAETVRASVRLLHNSLKHLCVVQELRRAFPGCTATARACSRWWSTPCRTPASPSARRCRASSGCRPGPSATAPGCG
ncbi:MAG: histidine kinase dimerization/phospho-acceptor domain-containing protein [Myxococcales bacterium]